LPWDHINVKKGREYLEKEQNRSLVVAGDGGGDVSRIGEPKPRKGPVEYAQTSTGPLRGSARLSTRFSPFQIAVTVALGIFPP